MMSPGRPLRIAVATAVLLAIVGAAWWSTDQRQHRQAPDVQFMLLDGSKPRLAELRGVPVLITFWATACRECIREMPLLEDLHAQFAGRGLEIIGVAMPYEPPDLVYQFQQKRNLPYAISLDIGAELAQAFGDVRLTPTTFLVSPSGHIVYEKTGPFDVEWLHNTIGRMLEAQPARSIR